MSVGVIDSNTEFSPVKLMLHLAKLRMLRIVFIYISRDYVYFSIR